MKFIKLILVVAVFSMTTACMGGYYMVTDTVNDKNYYTKKVKSLKSGAVSFKDATNGAQVTLQNNAVQTIKKDEFKAAVE